MMRELLRHSEVCWNGHPPLLQPEDLREGWQATEPTGSEVHTTWRQEQGGGWSEVAAAKQPALLLLGRYMGFLVAE